MVCDDADAYGDDNDNGKNDDIDDDGCNNYSSISNNEK